MSSLAGLKMAVRRSGSNSATWVPAGSCRLKVAIRAWMLDSWASAKLGPGVFLTPSRHSWRDRSVIFVRLWEHADVEHSLGLLHQFHHRRLFRVSCIKPSFPRAIDSRPRRPSS